VRSGSCTTTRIASSAPSDESRALGSVHTGAIYLHRGQAFEVVRLDLEEREARVVDADGGEYTQARSSTDIRVHEVEQSRAVGAATLHLGSVEVVTQVTSYQLRESRSRRILSSEPLDLPEQRLVTRAFWYTVDHELAAASADFPGTLHAVEHAMISLLPLFTICDRWDVGGVSTAGHPDTGAPTIFIYDGYPGGAGIAELGWEAGSRHLEATVEMIDACGCLVGCPSCVQSPKCGNGNEPLDKTGASRLLRTILSG
jgi:DEAD/DEAH box helicase domain-containing protein